MNNIDLRTFQSAILPDGESRAPRIGVSAILQTAILGIVLLMPLVFHQQMATAIRYTLIDVAKPLAPPRVTVVDSHTTAPGQQPSLRQLHVATLPRASMPTFQPAEARAPELNPTFEAHEMGTLSQPKRPREDVNVGTLTSGDPTSMAKSVGTVQTGGFGDTAGPSGSSSRGSVKSGVFETTVSQEAPRKKPATNDEPPISAAAVILDKPMPEYTFEGRSLRLEGDVTLDVTFLASGQVRVDRVITGLGHGLDESAAMAARQIRFKPALRQGQAVDYSARIRIEFRLAY